ncbi:MAG TPA: hypothetical protein VH539_04820 [Gemmatimonadaceae bacterium]|jgi:hypothetical protein
MADPEVIIVPVVFAIPAIVVFAKMWFKHKEQMATLKGSASNNLALEARLARIEEAVDTIALEMERMGEGQRFVTKLLAERAGQVPEGANSAGGGRLTTPQ